MSLAASAPGDTTKKSSRRPRIPLAVKFVAALAVLVVLVLLVNSAVSPLFSYAIGLLLAAILGIWLARRIAVPIGRLQEGVEQLADGDLSQRIAIRSGDEIGALADRVNTMAGRIQESHAALKAKAEEHTHDLDEALQQQTATANVLKVISHSAFDLDAVLETLIRTAIELCNATRGVIWLRKGEQLFLAAQVGYSEEWITAVRDNPLTPAADAQTTSGVAAFTGEIVHVEDVPNDPRFASLAAHKLGDYRAGLAVPLKRDGKVVGVISLSRPEARLFTERQIALVQTFADQAVIAIENVRLFEKVEGHNRELAEALDQQTATAEVLKTISSSAFDLDAVLYALVKSASDLCHSGMGYIYLRQGDVLQPRVQIGWSQEFQDHMKNLPVTAGRGSVAARVVLTGSVVQIPDALADPEYTNIEGQRLGGFRTLLGVPLLRDGVVTGVFVLARPTVSPFNAREIELVQTFSDQAVIAIENVRLFEEVKARTAEVSEALQQQTATGEVLRVIASSPADIRPVLEAVVESAARLCDAYDAVFMFRQDGALVNAAHHGPILADIPSFPVDRDTASGRAAVDRTAIHVHDISVEEKEYPVGRQMALRLGHRTVLATPLMREGEAIGVLLIRRTEVRPFSEKQIQLLKTFADQAVIAIENARLFDEVQARTAEVSEALQQQTATADVLKVISRSAFDLEVVFQTLIELATRLCTADRGSISRRDNDLYRVVATVGFSDEYRAYEDARPHPIGRGTLHGRAALERRTIEVPDIRLDPEYQRPEAATIGDFRAVLAVPILRDGQVLGVFALGRRAPGPFTSRQIELVETFADQAAIAIENVRLFEEVKARTNELSEALEQQTATGAILQVIAGSPTDIQPVLDAVAESAARLCDAYDATIYLLRSDRLAVGAHHGPIPIDDAGLPLARDIVTGRAVLDRAPVHVHDLTVAGEEFATGRMMAQRLGFRAILATPLLQEGKAIGALMIRRIEARAFGDNQIDLLKTFADQAVIAIENVRLFEEVQARTAELGEALQQQTATADVLKVISRSAFDLDTVLQTLVQSAARLCDAGPGLIFRRHGDVYRFASGQTLDPEFERLERELELRPGRGTVVGRALLEKRVVQVADVWEDPEYEHQDIAKAGNLRSVLAVPLLRHGEPIGAFGFSRDRVEPFTDRQVELVKTFADQAVIAIENVRLFDEVQARTAELTESLQQQTATADVLKVISASAFDLQSVLQTLIDSAVRLCGAKTSGIFMRDGDVFRLAAGYDQTPEYRAYEEANPSPISRQSWVGRTALDKAVVHIPDVTKDPEHGLPEAPRLGGYSAVLCVPLMREGSVIGVFAMTRPEPGPFTDSQIELVQTFADQAVIAIENVRLFDEVQARTAELGEALQQQTATADVLKAISRSTFDLQPVLDTLVESAARLCDADKGVIFKRDGDAYRWSANYGNPPELEAFAKARPFMPGRYSVTSRVALEARAIHVSDVLADPEYGASEYQKLGGYRTILCVPILREGAPVGVFALTRSEVRDFTPRQIELVETFADQAGIAIENVRLFEEVQARTRELSLSIEELKTAQGRLIQTEKLASLGQLTAGIAHEIKNPLNFVNNFSSLSSELIDELRELLEGAVLDEKTRADIEELADLLKGNLDKVVQHGKRADSIVRNMLLHSREGSGDHRFVDINAVVDESLGLAYHGARAERKDFNITLEKTLDPEAGSVDLYPQEITRVLLNLISNGFYATVKRGAEANGAYEPVLAASTKNLGDSVEIRIRDNGTGIPAEVKEKMFNPFFTTKPAGEGTGLGLSLSHDIIVKQHAGTIEVDTEPGSFTEFRIVLPRSAASLGKAGDAE